MHKWNNILGSEKIFTLKNGQSCPVSIVTPSCPYLVKDVFWGTKKSTLLSSHIQKCLCQPINSYISVSYMEDYLSLIHCHYFEYSFHSWATGHSIVNTTGGKMAKSPICQREQYFMCCRFFMPQEIVDQTYKS